MIPKVPLAGMLFQTGASGEVTFVQRSEWRGGGALEQLRTVVPTEEAAQAKAPRMEQGGMILIMVLAVALTPV